jgi:hypothetical protein
LEAVFILLEFTSPSRRILSAPIHSPLLWFAVSVLHQAHWLTRRRLVFDVYIEEYAVHRVMR